MLNDSTVVANVAAKNLETIKKFYSEILALKQVDENPAGIMYQCGEGKLFVYISDTAGSGKATCASWSVNDIEACVNELKDKGVNFEHYDDMPGGKRDGDIHLMGPSKGAWFKDPDGNILSMVQM